MPLFAVEWYDGAAGAAAAVPPAPLPVLPGHVRLTAAVRLPADDVTIAFVAGQDVPTVRAAVLAAGWRADRITPADWLAPREEDR